MLKKQMRVARGTARRIRRKQAQHVLSGKGFSIYWNGGKPDKKSLERALEYRNSGADE